MYADVVRAGIMHGSGPGLVARGELGCYGVQRTIVCEGGDFIGMDAGKALGLAFSLPYACLAVLELFWRHLLCSLFSFPVSGFLMASLFAGLRSLPCQANASQKMFVDKSCYA
jgi:hypothetical protein